MEGRSLLLVWGLLLVVASMCWEAQAELEALDTGSPLALVANILAEA